MIDSIRFVTLYVADQRASAEFYVDKLGFEIRTDAEMAPGKRWLELALPGRTTRLVISKAEDFGAVVDTKLGMMFALGCDDVTETHAELTRRGANPSDPVVEPWGSYIQVTDPDGYSVFISQSED
jgi:catechol 2,3-dioxygenase-like lactoylglutathione lyase family enzyme